MEIPDFGSAIENSDQLSNSNDSFRSKIDIYGKAFDESAKRTADYQTDTPLEALAEHFHTNEAGIVITTVAEALAYAAGAVSGINNMQP